MLPIPEWKNTAGREWLKVEYPLLNQLDGLGWEVIFLKGQVEGVQYPSDSGRETFKQVVLRETFVTNLQTINPWLQKDQILEVYNNLLRYSSSDLLKSNEEILKTLLENTSVSENRLTGEKSPSVFLIDFKDSAKNTFTAISQFKVQRLGSDNYIFPDVTLFVNGIPIGVIECKADDINDPISKAIDQLNRYMEHDGHEHQGNKELFFFNQITVATCGNIAKFGSITTTREKHFYRWTDPYPLTLQQLEDQFGNNNDQHRLVAGMFAKRNLLDIIRCYTVFNTDDNGRKIKVVGRYQQFRAVKKIIHKLKIGNNPKDRGGIVWHTQGSGKSLTMMFLVREMKAETRGLNEWKIVFVTDRTDLQTQLYKTGDVIGQTIVPANKIKDIPDLLKTDTSDISMIMIQKFHTDDEITLNLSVLNTSHKILVMTDEAHRSQYKFLRAQLDNALPNATHIGFTGTPIEKTEKVYGDYIDKYTMRQAIDDGVTLEIVYEGRTHNAEFENSDDVNAAFIDVFSDHNEDEQKEIIVNGTRVTKLAYLESDQTIKAKARDMVEHYVTHVFPNGFKAQVVASSRVACTRYKTALDEALKAKANELRTSNPFNVNIELLERLTTGVIISASQNDSAELEQYTNKSKQTSIVKSFTKSFEEVDGQVGMLIVRDMLLTGFDAPIEQVMYLDRMIVAHTLLQTIARVNRVGGANKHKGFIVDYVGVGHHLKKALEVYDILEQTEMLGCIRTGADEINELKKASSDMQEFLQSHGATDFDDTDYFFDLFYDDEIRFRFISLFNNFSKALDVVLPSREALTYLEIYTQLALINVQAGKHTRDSRLSMKGVSDKLRSIVDKYLISKGINQKVPPLSIMDKNFMAGVASAGRNKTKAAEVEHAIRSYLDEHMDEDPELYKSFYELLLEILKRNEDNWEAVYKDLIDLINAIKTEESRESYGLNKHEMKFFRLLEKEIITEGKPNEDQIGKLVNLTQEIVRDLKIEMNKNGFWEPFRSVEQKKVQKIIYDLLLEINYKEIRPKAEARDGIVARIMELAKTNNDAILYA